MRTREGRALPGDPAAETGGKIDARQRWLSPRALALHAGVLVLAPGCAVAGWWQATRALAGNTLSWVYSVEWPIFSLLAVAGWWHLLHEDPAEYRARREDARRDRVARRAAESTEEGAATGGIRRATARMSALLALGVVGETVAGAVLTAEAPFSRPSGLLPRSGEVAACLHLAIGTVLLVAALVLVARTRSAPRAEKGASLAGFASLMLAGAGGLLTIDRSVVRFLGMALMAVGALFAASAYGLVMLAARAQRREAARPGA